MIWTMSDEILQHVNVLDIVYKKAIKILAISPFTVNR